MNAGHYFGTGIFGIPDSNQSLICAWLDIRLCGAARGVATHGARRGSYFHVGAMCGFGPAGFTRGLDLFMRSNVRL
jgi:hypothetical protein